VEKMSLYTEQEVLFIHPAYYFRNYFNENVTNAERAFLVLKD